LVIASPESSAVSQNGGRVSLFYGRSQVLADTQLSSANTQISSESAGSHLGAAMTQSDLNNDGVQDLVLGAPGYGQDRGRIYYVPGVKNTQLSNLNVQSSAAIFTGDKIADFAGGSLSGGFDVTNDSADDLVIGAPQWDRNFTVDVGAAYFIKGVKKSYLSLITDLVPLMPQFRIDFTPIAPIQPAF